MAAIYNNGWQSRGFSLGNPVPANPAKAVDVTQATAFHLGLEVLAGYAGPATIEFWAYPALAGSNGALPDLTQGTLITEAELCDITGQTIAGAAINLPAGLAAGTYVWARPRCWPQKFVGIKGVSGDFAHLSAVAVFSNLK
jgi:hypothetical protein